MTKEREALRMALEALEAHADFGIKSDKAIAAIKEALAQSSDSVEQEPVATVQCIRGVTIGYLDVMQPVGTRLYTTPPKRQWVGLTDGKIDAVTNVQWGGMSGQPLAAHRAYARAIEAKLKELNHD